MEFGKISDQELVDTDFALPPDPAVNKKVLGHGTGNTRFFIGCAKWGRKDWVGNLYPKDTKEKDFLKYYATQFNSIEFNGFYYNVHSREQVEKWVDAVPPGFLFCPKFTQSITHIHRLKNVEPQVDQFLDVISAFGDHLGPVFLMPHPLMGKKHFEMITHFMESLPADLKVFLELRQEEWFNGKSGYDKEMFSFLSENSRGTVITDAAGRRDCVHMNLSVPECFIRFVGNGLHPTDYTRIDQWVARIKQWMKAGLETCYFFMHQHEELHSPELIKYFIMQMNKHCGTNIPVPVIYEQTSLF